MKIYKLKNFTRGWLVGDFKPSVIRTKKFEAAVMFYKKGRRDPAHKHLRAEEITVIISGKYKMNNKILKPGDIVLLKRGEAAEFYCVNAGQTVVIKSPSVIGDKYLILNGQTK